MGGLKKLLLVLIVILLASGGYFSYNYFKLNQEQRDALLKMPSQVSKTSNVTPSPALGPDAPPPPSTIEGTLACIPLKEGVDSSKKYSDCALGLKTDQGYFFIEGKAFNSKWKTGQKLVINGIVDKHIFDAYYNSVGLITANTITPL